MPNPNGAFSAMPINCGSSKKQRGCTEPGEIGALLRREGLYSSHLTDWRRQRRQGKLSGDQVHPRPSAEMVALQEENARLQARLAQADLIISAQKKLSQALQAMMRPGAVN